MALLADPHVIWPWMSRTAIRLAVAEINAIEVDVVLLLGDYIGARPTPGIRATSDQVAAVLSNLEAPLGVHAILGNHDWRDDPLARSNGYTATGVTRSLTDAGLRPLVNTARRLAHHGDDIWLVGLDSQRGHLPIDEGGARHDPDQAFAEVPENALSILLAHEPDYFKYGDRRPVLQVSGHTHGGQVNLFGWRPFTPSSHSDELAYGYVEEDGRHLIVSAGLGYSHIPLRVAQPPEITLVHLRQADGDDAVHRSYPEI